MNKESIYKVCATNNEVYVQIREKASYLNCAPLRSFLHQMVNEGNRVFVVDFQNCSSMDSTFLGILVGLALQLRKFQDGGSLTLLNLIGRNLETVEKVSKIANLHDFIVDELPNQYQTTIGERGVRLSGGQRQRIGIARALYHNPQILILDEATSALDNRTEKAIMDAVNNLGNNITIIIIAHRLSTVKKCDQIYLLEKGELKNQGTFNELLKTSENFRINANN